MLKFVVVAALVAVVALGDTTAADDQLEGPVEDAQARVKAAEKRIKDATAKLADRRKAAADADANTNKMEKAWRESSKERDRRDEITAQKNRILRKNPKCGSCEKEFKAAARYAEQWYPTQTAAYMKYEKANAYSGRLWADINGTQRDLDDARRQLGRAQIALEDAKRTAERNKNQSQNKGKKLFDHTPGDQQTLTPSLRGSE